MNDADVVQGDQRGHQPHPRCVDRLAQGEADEWPLRPHLDDGLTQRPEPRGGWDRLVVGHPNLA